ncbi:MAG: hypothetical protein LIO79_00130 [Rikenellaceae bacterium]|nr:hypothetical protein [Rikenellaceae bacterium]
MTRERYSARITRENPSAFVIMLDISGSMDDMVFFDGRNMRKQEAVTQAINDFIAEIVARCKREDGYRDYIDLAILGYGGDKVISLLPGSADDEFFRTTSELARMRTSKTTVSKPRLMPDGSQTVVSLEKRVWIKSVAQGKTPMFKCFLYTYDLLKQWLVNHKNKHCFPPIVINITDGEATDAEPHDLINITDKIKSLCTKDGNILIFNLYLSSDTEARSVFLPSSEDELPSTPYAQLMYETSSILPEIFVSENNSGKERMCRGVCYNASLENLVNMLNIGTINVNMIK